MSKDQIRDYTDSLAPEIKKRLLDDITPEEIEILRATGWAACRAEKQDNGSIKYFIKTSDAGDIEIDYERYCSYMPTSERE